MVIRKQEQPQQRIYLGGIDPSRGLTVVEVWERLQAKLEDATTQQKMKWSDLHLGRCFLQLTVTAATEGAPPPLTVIKSWFHNVTWKACKLVVEEARPHFLQRLQDERTSRSQQSPGAEVVPADAASFTAVDAILAPHPRHWRIKRGYVGEPVRHVDTQPCDVTSWSMLARIRQRHVAYQEKQRAASMAVSDASKRRRGGDQGISLKEAQKHAYYNRAIRMRFTEDDLADVNNASHSATLIEEQSDSDDDVSSVQNIKESDSSGDNGDDHKIIPKKRGQYVWSESDDDDSEIDGSSKVIDAIEKPSTRFPINKTSETIAEITSTKKMTYEWSDDDDGDTSEDDATSPVHSSTRVPSDLDEFESAFLNNSSIVPSNALPETLESKAAAAHGDDFDLSHDVEMNLNVLSQLFPEISKTPTASTHAVDDTKAVSSLKQKPAVVKPSSTSGWDAAGQMLRFDPSLPQSASLLVVDRTSESTSVDKDNAKNVPSFEEMDQEMVGEDITEAKEVAVAGVYEQKKLEQVFKEVREVTSIVASNDTGAIFSFGFDLGATDAPMEESNSFAAATSDPESVVLSTAAPSGPTTAGLPMDTDDDNAMQRHDSISAMDQHDSRPRYRAFDFPSDDVLDDCVRHFYFDINDGARIINDREGWRNDPAVKDKWMKERFALTQDWKRKRKYALAKKQKRQQSRR
jgi:hypothetical protein